MVKLLVRVAGPRPDFRLVLAFVWGDADTDTDGNSRNPASREWTKLYAQNRGRPDEVFNVFPASADPLVLQVHTSFRRPTLGQGTSLTLYLLGQTSAQTGGA